MADLAKLVHPDQRGLLRRVSVCPAPDDVTGNASYVLTYTAGGQLETITKTIGGISYTRTLTYTGTKLTGIGAWVEQ